MKFKGNCYKCGQDRSHVEGIQILKRRAVLGPDGGDDMTVAILNRLVTSRNQIEADPRHREILLAQMHQR